MSDHATERSNPDVAETFRRDDGRYESGRHRRPTLCRYALAAIAAQIDRHLIESDPSAEWSCLLDAERAVGARPGDWAATLSEYLAQPSHDDRRLIRLGREVGLSVLEMLAVACAAGVEDDLLVGRVVARVQSPLGGSRPTLGLLSTALAAAPRHVVSMEIPNRSTDRRRASANSRNESADRADPAHALATGNAVASGLLTLLDDGAPLVERPVRVPLHLCLALRGLDGAVPDATIGDAGTSDVPLSPTLVEHAVRHARGLASAPQRALAIRTTSLSEGMAAAHVIGGELGRRALFIRTVDLISGLSPWLLLRNLLPVFCLDLQPGENCRLPLLPSYDGPLIAIVGPDGGVETASGAALNWTIPVPPPSERQALWEQALGDPSLAADLARHHRHRCGRIAHLGRLARHHSALSGRAQPVAADVLAASWGIEGGGLDALAQPLPDPIPDEALVLTPALRRELETLLMRCHARDGLADGLGASAATRYRPGVRGLFVGPSGTGKTLAAGWLATKLGLPLYRVDLAAITSKYIGETEKNLAQLFARAEQAELVLLFDEADSLFGKRTDVQQANDRFANAQTNYLLQRIESFDGITILTSNSRSRFDAAFARRLDMIVEFPDHGPSERRALWQSHLGARHGLSPQDLNRLAATADLVGGHIRNAVLTAAVLARAEGRDVALPDLVEGLGHEYRKLARALPIDLRKCIREAR